MSALTCWQGLEAIFKTVVTNTMLGEPTTIQEAPALIVVYGSFDHPLKNNPPARNLVGFDHVFAVRLAIKWQENPAAEMQLVTLVDQIPEAVDADPHLGGRLTRGIASISSAVTGFAEYGKEKYRIVDYTCAVIEKREGT